MLTEQKQVRRKKDEAAAQEEPKISTKREIHVKINGVPYDANVEARLLLVHFVRDFARLTGTHVGCDTTNCGACTLIFNGRSVKSCTLLAVQADGAEITTIEGLARDGEFHPIQKGFWEYHGLQCGFCTPGMIMQAYWLLKENPNPTEQQIRKGIAGNLCRCTGYQNIVRAIQAASKEIATSSKWK